MNTKRLLTATVSALGLAVGSAHAAPLLSVDFNDTVAPVGPGPNQAGFTAWDEGTGWTKTNVGGSGLDVTITGAGPGLGDGMYTRGNAVDGVNAGFTYADLYNDWLFGTTVDFSISGLVPNTPYEITLYSYDGYFDGGATTFGAKVGSDTSGPTIVTQTIAAAGTPTANDDMAYTGTWTSTTGTLDLTASSGATNIVRVNGFEISAITVTAPVPEPSTTALLGLGGLALILRRRK